MPAPLINSATEHASLKQQLIEMFGGGDDQALCDTVDGISDFVDLVAATMRSRREDEAYAAAIGSMIEQLQERKTRLQDRAQAKKELIEAAMIRADRRKIALPDMTLTITPRNPKVIITERDKLPQGARRFLGWEPDKVYIKEMLSDGQDVPGAELSNGGVGLTIRTK